MKMICIIILLLIFPVYFASEINRKISDVNNHIFLRCISISPMVDHVIL